LFKGKGVWGFFWNSCPRGWFPGVFLPVDAQVALGGAFKSGKPRDWANMMRCPYYSTPTGFVTAYWNPPTLNGVLMKLSVGQYLAKDKGATIDVAKRFDSGVAVGVWAAISNVSKDDYGEGGFSKGFYISIPLDLMPIGPNRNGAGVPGIPLSREGDKMRFRNTNPSPFFLTNPRPHGKGKNRGGRFS
ncbi:YjbH domain-containing protein, partial [Escherichia coli]|nr:YjbH domain-containing protein [Escherichia coli]